MGSKVWALAALVAVTQAVAGAPNAQAPRSTGATTSRAAVLESLAACRAITGASERLACFDAASARLDEAERSGEVVVMDRGQVRAAKRDAFGFSLPSFDLFDRTERQRTEEVDRLESTVASAGRDGSGKWSVTLANGQVWRQVDNEPLTRVRSGDKVQIRRAALNSFFMNVGGQRAVRARRDR